MTLPEQMAKAAYEKREPGMVWSALSEASREAMVEDMRVGLEVLTSSGYASYAGSAGNHVGMAGEPNLFEG